MMQIIQVGETHLIHVLRRLPENITAYLDQIEFSSPYSTFPANDKH